MSTIKDIATIVGVAPSTVSRALRGSEEISDGTRARILQVAEELDYTPNLLARNLVRARNNIIGVLILEFANPFFVPVIEAVEDLAENLGYVTMISQSRRTLAIEKRVVRRLRMVRVGGLIVTPVLQDVTHLVEMKRRGTPVVVVGRDCHQLDTISIDNRLGGRLVARHLLELGHRRVGAVTTGESFNEPEQSRVQGMREGLKDDGCAWNSVWTFSTGSPDPAAGRQAAAAWGELSERPTAIFCSTDRLAIGFVHSALAAGIRVPDDVAVVGFDDIPLAEYLEVPLTTVAYPKYEAGDRAAQRLIELMEDPEEMRRPERVLLEPQLIVRESSGLRE